MRDGGCGGGGCGGMSGGRYGGVWMHGGVWRSEGWRKWRSEE